MVGGLPQPGRSHHAQAAHAQVGAQAGLSHTLQLRGAICMQEGTGRAALYSCVPALAVVYLLVLSPAVLLAS